MEQLEKAWKEYHTFAFYMNTERFGQYFINTYTKDYTNPDIFYDQNAHTAYDKLYHEILAGNITIK